MICDDDDRGLARLLIDHRRDINHVLYVTVANEIEMKRHPDINIWRSPLPGWMRLRQITLTIQLVFVLPGEAS